MSVNLQALTEKEKQTLRLMGRGHDAKSMARHLGLSVHTVNDRLRVVRRKLSVSSSREAARLLLASEPEPPDLSADTLFGADGAGGPAQHRTAIDGRGSRQTALRVIAGVVIMSLIVSAATLLMLQQPASTPAAPSPQASASQVEVVGAAGHFLALIDAANWEESWRATGKSFQSVNTVATWANASVAARKPLGAMLSRTRLSQERVPAPPNGYEMVKFRTDFANRSGVIETVTLAREGAAWKVVGVWID